MRSSVPAVLVGVVGVVLIFVFASSDEWPLFVLGIALVAVSTAIVLRRTRADPRN